MLIREPDFNSKLALNSDLNNENDDKEILNNEKFIIAAIVMVMFFS